MDDKQLREAIVGIVLKEVDEGYPVSQVFGTPPENGAGVIADQIVALFHTYGNRERVDELEHIDDKPNVRLWFDGFYGVDDRIKELNREVES